MLKKYRYLIFLFLISVLMIFALTVLTSPWGKIQYASLFAFTLARAVTSPKFTLPAQVGRVASAFFLLIGAALLLAITFYRQETAFEFVASGVVGFMTLDEVLRRYWRRPPQS